MTNLTNESMNDPYFEMIRDVRLYEPIRARVVSGCDFVDDNTNLLGIEWLEVPVI